MDEGIGIVMSLIDKVSAPLKTIGNNTKAFDKTMQELEQGCAAYDKTQDKLVKDSAQLKSAMETTAKKIQDARKAYRDLGDVASKRILDDAIDEQEVLKRSLGDTTTAMKENQRALSNLMETSRKAENGAGVGSPGIGPAVGPSALVGFGKNLAASGVLQMLSGSLGGSADAFLSSAMGEPTARMASSVVSGIASGAAAGMVAGLPGAAVGAVVGGLSGAISGGTQMFQAEDDAFKGYAQEQYGGAQQRRGERLTAGTGIAGSREQSKLAFDTLLGGEQEATDYLAKVQTLAAKTNYTYDEITGYTKSLLNSFKPDQIFDVLTTMSDATAGLSLSGQDVDQMINGMTKMKLTGKATTEYLNFFTERGVNTYAAIAQYRTAHGEKTSESDVTGLISKGKVSGADAVEAILGFMGTSFAGLSDKLAGSYIGMKNNLGDVMDNVNGAIGTGYNNERKPGIQKEMDAYGGSLGDTMKQANEAIGRGQAFAEGMAERYRREAMSAFLEGKDATLPGLQGEQGDRLNTMHGQYTRLIEASARGDSAAGIQIQKLKDEAEAMAQSAYDVSDTGIKVQDAEKDLIAAIRDNTYTLKSWVPKYTFGQEAGKGQGAISDSRRRVDPPGGIQDYESGFGSPALDFSSANPEEYTKWQVDKFLQNASRNAYGLDRVPRDNFPALLHEGERVLTANQARQRDNGGSTGGVVVNMYGTSIREEADVGKIARAVAAEVVKARTLGV